MTEKFEIIFPDYADCNLGIIASILKHYQIEISTPSNPEIDRKLASGAYRNVIFFLLDGMGTRVLEKNLGADSFLRRNSLRSLKAVYPSTTTCVMSSLFSGLQPISHAWLAWSLYFREWHQNIDLFPYRDSFTGELIRREEKNVLDFMDFQPIFPCIEEATAGEVNIHCVFTEITRPRLMDLAANYLTKINSFSALAETALQKSRLPGQNFIFAYYKSPDDLMHRHGVTHPLVSEFLAEADRTLVAHAEQFEDALVIISADHGMLEMENHFRLDEIPPINELLREFPAGDPRAKMIPVQPGKEDLFAQRFKREFGDEFLLFSREEFLSRGFLGAGDVHPKVNDFLGDFVACGVGTSDLLYSPPGGKPAAALLGHHAGLTADEMLVPLILLDGKSKS